MNHNNRPATSAAEYLENTRDSNKQRELHPADMGSIDLGAFQLMSRDGQRRTWLAASADDKRGLALQIIRSRNIGPDAETLALYLECCEAKFGSDVMTPDAAALVEACAERGGHAELRGDGHEAARYGRLADALLAGARLAWSGGVLLVASPSGGLYHVGAAGCDCPNSRSRRPNCWHLLARDLLEELADDRAAAADILADAAAERAEQALDETEARWQLAGRLCAARSRCAA